MGKLLARPGVISRFILDLVRFNPDRILCGTSGTLLWACFVYAKLKRIPIVCSRHNCVAQKSDPFMRRAVAAIDGWCLRRVNGIACHGPFLVAETQDIGVKHGRIFEFDVDFDDLMPLIAAASGRTAAPSRGREILFIGRNELAKGVTDLLEACRELLQEDPSVRLIYVGGGDATGALQRSVDALGLGERVTIVGQLPHAELVPLLTRAAVVVTPSRPTFPEGRCMVAMEALVCGTPVIAPDYGPFPFLIEHESNGLLYEAGSIDDLRRQIERVFGDCALHDRLIEGARAAGRRLQTPPRRFGSAIVAAFAES